MSFKTALSGLNAASTDLSVIGNNVANASTTGFKESRTEFADVYTSSFQGIGSITPGSGVQVANITQQFTQGNIGFTDNNLDLAINGDGFYVLSNGGALEYTRAGEFKLDSEGYVVSNNKQRLQVFPATTVGGETVFNTGVLSDFQLTTTTAAPSASSQIQANMNLDASETVPVTTPFDATDPTSFNHSTSLSLYDSLGNQHTATYYFVASGTANQWEAYLQVDGNDVTLNGGADTSATLSFAGDGSLASANGAPSGVFSYDTYAIPGTNPLDLQIDLSEMTQYGSEFSVNNLTQDGYTTGQLNGIEISDSGVIFARFTNGQADALGQVALAKFTNQQGLSPVGDTNWIQSFDSGDVIYGSPGSSNFGGIESGALEDSNVDISEQLVEMIVAQRNFQANAQMITTEDTITQTIINIR